MWQVGAYLSLRHPELTLKFPRVSQDVTLRWLGSACIQMALAEFTSSFENCLRVQASLSVGIFTCHAHNPVSAHIVRHMAPPVCHLNCVCVVHALVQIAQLSSQRGY
jgi:hypothetical protein